MVDIAICDDDRSDGERLSEFIRQYISVFRMECHLELFESGEQFLESGFIPDILFLDIIMNEKDGIQIGSEVKDRYEDMIIIYTTNLPEKMMIAVNRIHSFGYLIKPIDRKDVFSMLSDAMKKLKGNRKARKDVVTFLSEDNTVIKLSAADIYYFEYCDRRVKIVTKDNTYVCKDKIGSIAEKMEQYGFAMSHQSFVVNLYCVNEIKKQALVMKNGDEVFLAQKRASAIRKKLMQAVRESG